MRSVIETSDRFDKALKTLINDPTFLRNEIFRIPAVRDALTLDRYQNIFASTISKSSSDKTSKVTIEHNTDHERMFFSELSKRPDLISNVLACLNSVRQNASRMKVLSIGARTEAELFSLVNAGFYVDNIECIDLFSYSPSIKIGDVNNLLYAAESFDIVLCGWVLEFCNDIDKACAEIRRVTKPGGYICIGGMHHPSSTDLAEYNKHKHHDDRVWYCSIGNIKNRFGVKDTDFVFKSDIEPGDADKRGEVVAIFKAGVSNGF